MQFSFYKERFFALDRALDYSSVLHRAAGKRGSPVVGLLVTIADIIVEAVKRTASG